MKRFWVILSNEQGVTITARNIADASDIAKTMTGQQPISVQHLHNPRFKH